LRLLLIGAFGAVGTLARYGLQGLVQIKMGSTFPYGTLLINLTGCFFPWFDRTASAEPRDRAPGMAHGHRNWIFRRVHHVFEFRLGNGKNAGGGRMALGNDLRGRERGVWLVAFCGGNSPGQSVLRNSIRGHLKVAATRVIHDAPEI